MTRIPFLVSVMLAFALAATVLAAALLVGLVPAGGPAAVATTPPARTFAPAPSEPPTAEPSLELPPTAEPTVQPSPGGTHTVEPGESLSTIGELYGIPWLQIAEANGISEPYVIQVGQELIIPSAAAPPTAGAGFHIVEAGESIISIAEQYGIDPTDLADANPDVADWNLIYVGQRLVIPDGSQEPEPDAEESPAE